MQELIQLEDDFCGYKGLRNLELSDVLEDVSSETDSQQAVKLFYRLKELLNVRQIGKDAKMIYKDEQNGVDYDVRGEYDFTSYHSYKDYIIKNIKISRQKKESNLKMGT